MKQQLKKYLNIIAENISDRVTSRMLNNSTLSNSIAYQIALDTIMSKHSMDKTPEELFSGVSDGLWFWLNTEGKRRSTLLRNILPGAPDEYTQVMFTGDKGDRTFEEGFNSYQIFKDQYEKFRGPINKADSILDFGCGWGRIIRYFLKDIPPNKIWGCDPVPDMISLCKEQNKWCNFELINTSPPTPFHENKFDLIYSFSVFSHLSEDLHLSLLPEIRRILKPGGIFIATTRNVNFIKLCEDLRNHSDKDNLHPAISVSAVAFPNAQQSQNEYEQGKYCHHSFGDENWPFWGETAIPKDYVLSQWSKYFTFLDFIDDEKKCAQNVIIVQKP